MANALDELIDMPGPVGDELRRQAVEAIPPGEFPQETVVRKRVENRLRAEDLAARDIPSFQNASGDISAVTDETGKALTHYDAKHGIAYDSRGEPKTVSYEDEHGPPSLKDPFEGLPVETDEKTGEQYQVRRGLPHKWVGRDEAVAGAAQQKQADKAIKTERDLLGRQLSFDEAEHKKVQVAHKSLQEQLTTQVPNLLDPKYAEADLPTAIQVIDDQFNEQYAAPEANETGWFNEELTPEAAQIRKALDESKGKAYDAAKNFYVLKEKGAELTERIDAARTRASLDNLQLLAHARGLPGPYDEAPARPAPEPITGETATDKAIADAKAGNKTYQIDDKDSVQFKPDNLSAGLDQAVKDGIIDPKWAEENREAFKNADAKYKELQKAAGSDQVLKALLHGFGIGGAFLAGAAPGAKVGALAGAAIPIAGQTGIPSAIGAVLGGLATGTTAAFFARKGLEKLSEYNDAVKSLTASAELHPVASGVGELTGFVLSPTKLIGKGVDLMPSGIRAFTNLYKAGTIGFRGAAIKNAAGEILNIDEARTAALKIVGRQLGIGALSGVAFEGAIRPAFDAARYTVADAIGIPHAEFKAPDAQSILTMGALAIVTGGHSIQFAKWSARDVASIMSRGRVREDAKIDLTANNPGAVVSAFEKRGVKLDSQSAQEMSRPLTKQEIAVWEALKAKTERMERSGAFDDAGVKFTGAEQAQIRTFGKEGEPIVSAGVEAVPNKPGKPPEGPSKGLPAPTKPKGGEPTGETGKQPIVQAESEIGKPISKGQPPAKPADTPSTGAQPVSQDAIDEKGKVLKVVAPEGATAHPAQTDQVHVVSTAIKDNGQILVGKTWNEEHEGIVTRHERADIPEENRGFLIVQNGEQRFVGRHEGHAAAKIAGQIVQGGAGTGTQLRSTDLQPISQQTTPTDQAAHEAATSPTNGLPQPTQAQKEAGNYKVGPLPISGLDISIENPQGSIRSGESKAGKKWSVTMADHYGYIKGTKGKDKDHVDVFVKPGTPDNWSGPVYVVNQKDPASGKFDEHKSIIGAQNIDEARTMYQRAHQGDWKGEHSIVELSMPEFKEWAYKADKSQPLAQPAASSPPTKAERSKVEKLALGAMGKHRETLENIGHGQVPKAGAVVGVSGIETTGEGIITVDSDKLARVTRGMTERQQSKYIQRAIEEEIAHVAVYKYLEKNQDSRADLVLWGREDDELGQFLAGSYNEWYQLNDEQRGHEKLRAVLQKRWTGRLTEAAYRFLKGFLEFLRGIYDKLTPRQKEIVSEVEAMMKGEQVARAPPTKTQTPKREPIVTTDPRVIDAKARAKEKAITPKLESKLDDKTKAQLKQAFEGLFAALPTKHLAGKEKAAVVMLKKGKTIDQVAQMFTMKPEQVERAYDKSLAELPSLAAGTPKLRRGEKQGDIFSGQTEELTLAGETGIDWDARQKAAEAEQKVKEEGKKISDAAQGSLFSGKPTVSTQRAIPPDKLGQFVELAQSLIAAGVDTPEKLANEIDANLGEKARPFSQALWDAIGMVKPELRGTHNWEQFYKPTPSPDRSPKPEKARKRTLLERRPDGGFSEDPLIASIIGEFGGLLSKTAARAKMGAERFEKNKSLWDDAPSRFADPTHAKIYNPSSGQNPDVVAQGLVDLGLLPAGATEREMWSAIIRASDSAKRTLSHEREQNRLSKEAESQAEAEPETESNDPLADLLPNEPTSRSDLIQRISEASREPQLEIVERWQTKGDDGKWYFAAGGIPIGVNLTDERRLSHYAFRTSQGTTVGTPGKTEQELIDRWKESQDKRAADFAGQLREMTDEQLVSQARYWLKEEIDPVTLKSDDRRSSDNLESDSGDSRAGVGGREDSVQTGSGPTGYPDGLLDDTPTGRENPAARGVLSADVPSAPDRAPSDQPIREPASATTERPSGSVEPERSGASGDRGLSPDTERTKFAGENLVVASDSGGLAGSGGSGGSELDAIKRAAPALQPEQADDVRFIEARLIEQGKPGVMLTNGTGTGKTFSGLGTVKRALDRGAKHILVVAPSDKIGSDWVDTAKHFFGIKDIAQLSSTVDNGKLNRVSITTYANFGQNDSLVERPWDLIVTDESHYNSSSEQGDSTLALDALRALTWHPQGLHRRVHMLEPEAYNGLRALSKLERQLSRKRASLTSAQQDQRRAFQATLDAAGKKVREEFAAKTESARPKVLFMSATPFAYRKSIDYANGYLFDYPEVTDRGYNTPSPYGQFMIENFGYRMRYGRLTEPENATATGILERRFAERLMREKSMRGRALVVPFDYSRDFVLTESQLGAKIDEIITHMMSTARLRTLSGKIGVTDYLQRRFILESLKAREAIPRIRKHIVLGRKTVVFHDYKMGGALNPLVPNFEQGAMVIVTNEQGKREEVYLADAFAELKSHFHEWDEISSELSSLQSPIVQFTAAFTEEGILGIFNGNVSKKDRRRLVAEFNKHGGKMKVFLAQRASAKEGISLHDLDGDEQRAFIDLGIPGRPTDAIQSEGRIYRIGVKSNAIDEYLVTGTNFERWTFAQTIAQRASTAENLAMGEGARALLQSFSTGFNEASLKDPSLEQGVGGKAADEVRERGNPYTNAVALYYTNEKKTSRSKSREGMDYFPTPEPLGFKMVEWTAVQPGEKFLEPSAGHGAISRFGPDSTNRHAVEPSNELAGRLALNAPDTEIHNVRFEEFNIVNKFDVIAMNSPWGVAGKIAMEHLIKATKHLKDGGRIVALIPRGAMDKKLEDWLASDESKGIYLRAEIALPPSLFQRAGTNVSARVIILDKSTEDLGPTSQRDFSSENIKDVQELFARLEHTGVPARPEKKILEPEPEPEEMPGRAPPKGGYEADPTAERKPMSPEHTKASDFEPREFMHTRDRVSVYVAKTARYMSKDEFSTAKARAKQFGGYYSSFKGAGAIPGFHFKTAEARDQFIGGTTKPTEGLAPIGMNILFDSMGKTGKGLVVAHEGDTMKVQTFDEYGDKYLLVNIKAGTGNVRPDPKAEQPPPLGAATPTPLGAGDAIRIQNGKTGVVSSATSSKLVVRLDEGGIIVAPRSGATPHTPRVEFSLGAGTPFVDRSSPEHKRMTKERRGTMEDDRGAKQKLEDLFNDFRANASRNFEAGVFDTFAPIRAQSVDAWKAAHLTQELPSVIYTLLEKGQVQWRADKDKSKSWFAFKDGTNGLLHDLKPILDNKEKTALWELYVMAKRSDRLLNEGREHNFGRFVDPSGNEQWDAGRAREEINEALKLGELYPEFEEARQKWSAFNKSILDMAQGAGLINQDQRSQWARDDYAPFYRLMELAEGAKGPTKKPGLANQRANIRKLKGAPGRVAVLENIYRNIESMVDASFKNAAMQKIVAAFEDSGLIEREPYKHVPFNASVDEIRDALKSEGIDAEFAEEDLDAMIKFWRARAPKGHNIISVMRDGQAEYWRVHDPLLLRAVLDLGPEKWGWLVNVMGGFKRLLTEAVTFEPVFAASNLFRDTIANWMQQGGNMAGVASGFTFAAKETKEMSELTASGAGLGTWHRLGQSEIRRHFLKAAGKKSVLISSAHDLARLLVKIHRAGENANRLQRATDVKQRGGAPIDIAFSAKDVLNFSSRGGFKTIKLLVSVLPFFNARLQGLHKLYRSSGVGGGGRGGKGGDPKDFGASVGDPKSFFLRAALFTFAALALSAMFWRDKRYQDLEDWDRDNYFHFWIGDLHLRFPKPFELGFLFATMPERITQAMFGVGEASAIWTRFWSGVYHQLEFNPVPQMIRPGLEAWANKDVFTGRQIVPETLKYRQPEQQFTPWTSETFKEIAKAVPDSAPAWMRSPVQLEHFFRGYFATLGMYAVDMSDVLVSQVTGATPPKKMVDRIPVLNKTLQRFAPDDAARQSRFIAEFYDFYKKLDVTLDQIKELEQSGQFVAAFKARKENAPMLARATEAKSTYKLFRDIGRRRQEITSNPSLTGTQKRTQLNSLNQASSSVARTAMTTLTKTTSAEKALLLKLKAQSRAGRTQFQGF